MPITVESGANKKAEPRRQPRSSMFLKAVMHAEAEQAPVKVRNMSVNGAMVESALAPSPGTIVHLVRGALQARGIVVWTANNRCGLKFLSGVSVNEWLAALAKAEQQRVDEVVSRIKAGAMLLPLDGPNDRKTSDEGPSRQQLADDLEAVVNLMQDLEDDLVSSDETLARHGLKLQNIDVAMQTIRAIAHHLTATTSGNLVSAANLDSLRVVCAHALASR